jgi:hypothetical protein
MQWKSPNIDDAVWTCLACSRLVRIHLDEPDADDQQIRKLVHNLLNQNVARTYVPYQMLENKQMLNDLLDTPDDFLKHIRRYSNALTTTMVSIDMAEALTKR